MTRILRARATGGKAYNPTQVAGTINSSGAPRSGSVRDSDMLRAFARLRATVRRHRGNDTIGSKGKL